MRQAVSPFQMKIFLICSENRHLAEWRFSRFFIMIVTVKEPICKVIRMVSPPFGWCGQPPAVVCSALPPVETGGFCIIAEISTICKNFCSDPPDTAGGYGIRPYGVGGDARHRPGNVVTAAMCRERTMFAPTAPLLNCIVGRGLDPSAGRCKHRPLQKRPAGIFFPAGRFSLVILVIIDQASIGQDLPLGIGHSA